MVIIGKKVSPLMNWQM